ncbi:MAG: hypothetical protein ABW321_30245 [Polyangiales bacterium]
MRDRNTETLHEQPAQMAPRSRTRIPASPAYRVSLQLAHGLVAALITICGAGFASVVRAEPEEPARLLALASAGVPVRLTLDDTLDQSRVAPAFGSVLLGYALPGGRLRHGFGAALSWNMGHEGGYTTPVYAADQFALMPSYLAHYTFNPDVFGIGHVGVPILVRGGPSVGLEVGAAIAYRVFAGTGVFAGIDLDGFLGLGFNLLASFELGVVIDYEVLP